MRILFIIITFFVGVSLLFQSCDSPTFNFGKNDSIQTDSLFLGFHLGMPKKDFFDQCTELNKQEKVTQGGSGSTNVEYRIKDEYDSEISMRFFPTFIDEKIFEMPVTYSYIAWAPWNRQYWAEELLPKVLERYKLVYGDDFKLINHKVQGKVYYKIDGKRRINIFIKDEQHVQVVFSDLRVEKKLIDAFEKSKLQQ